MTRLKIEDGGQVYSWFFPVRNVDPATPTPVVIIFHGNAEIIDGQQYYVNCYNRMGVSVLLPEYRGYGAAAGIPSQDRLREDNIRFYDELVRRPDVDRSRIVFHGISLGGGVACDLATQRRPAALILQSTFASVARMAHGYAVPGFLATSPFHSDRVVAALDVPVFIAHGWRDELIPVRHARLMRTLAPRAHYVEYECGHNDFPGPGNEKDYWERVHRFLIEAGIVSRPGS